MRIKIRGEYIELPDQLSVGDLAILNNLVHAQVSLVMQGDDSFSLTTAFNAASLTGTALYQWMRDNEDWS